MSQVTSPPAEPGPFWWGLGVSVEGQSVVVGGSVLMARMDLFEPRGTHCVIRIVSEQLGPGIGAGGDLMLVIATGITDPASFAKAEIEGGWHVTLRDGLTFDTTPSSFVMLTDMVKTVPIAEIGDFMVANPDYVDALRDVVGAFHDAVGVAKDATAATPRLRMFPLTGVGMELGLTYQYRATVELVTI